MQLPSLQKPVWGNHASPCPAPVKRTEKLFLFSVSGLSCAYYPVLLMFAHGQCWGCIFGCLSPHPIRWRASRWCGSSSVWQMTRPSKPLQYLPKYSPSFSSGVPKSACHEAAPMITTKNSSHVTCLEKPSTLLQCIWVRSHGESSTQVSQLVSL